MKNDADDILNYMSRWINEEKWDAMQCMANAASVGCPDALEHMADYLMSTGCIDSTQCYSDAKTLEQDVESLARKFRKISKKRQDLVYNRIFDGVLMISCEECNLVSFVHDGNEELYPELYKKCWECEAEHLLIHRYKVSDKKKKQA